MPSGRRMQGYILLGLLIFASISFLSGLRSMNKREASRNDFYSKTTNGLNKQHGGSVAHANLKDHDGDGSVDEDDEKLAREMGDRLRAAEQKAKDLANAKAPHKPDSPGDVVGVGSSAQGQSKGKSRISQDDDNEDVGDSEAEIMLNRILQRAPMVIFSKSYCPYSKRAKAILLEKYTIDPAPYVVELDEHRLGKELQDALLEKTGRRTVPNIMINGKSIGGSDEVSELDTRKTLIDKIKSVGGNKLSMREKFTH
ncbi:hypothetical protein F5Y16DRAFT_361571 [Xylariaceae sp. FL0255]|nr:hypothetical protein F5Y16DRAFT_361571 [Xylariaceae sp. FL0255]